MKRTFTMLLAVPLLGFAATAAAKSLVVDADGQGSRSDCDSTKSTPYTTITSALNAANPGDKVYVCPGVYNEQIAVPSGVSIQGMMDATIRPSPMVVNSGSTFDGFPIAAAILVDGATDVNISRLTVDTGGYGLESSGCSVDVVGVYFRNASGSLTGSAIKNAKLGAGLEGCQSGQGVFVQTSALNRKASLVSPGGVTISGNSVHDFQKNGITADEVGTVVTISDNAVSGNGPSPIIAQNGIQLAYGAEGTISGNRVNNVIYSPCTDASTFCYASSGIIVFEAAGTVTNNVVSTTQVGIYYQNSGGTVSGNTVQDTLVYDGVYVAGDNNLVAGNKISDSDESAVYIDGSNNTFNSNMLNETPVGAFIGSGSGNIAGAGPDGNRFFNVGIPVLDASLPRPASARSGRVAKAGKPATSIKR